MFKKIVGLGFSTKGKNKKAVNTYIKALVDSGAGEFFTGYNPPYWYEKYGFEVSPNGRFSEHEQITDIETLKEIVEEVHSHDLEIFVNLNAWYYTSETFPAIEKMLKEFQELGIDGIICGNIGILEYLKQINYKGKINISTILALYNSEAIRFFLENYNINKVILSREITLKEIEAIVNDFPQTSFEVFGEGDFCRYNNGLCYAEHKYGAKDICTVVVNDLVFKKRYKPNFKEIILNEEISQLEKIELFDHEYLDVFAEIEELTSPLNDILNTDNNNLKVLFNLLVKNCSRDDLYFDSMKPIISEHNKNIIIFFKGLTKILENKENFPEDKIVILQNCYNELEINIKSGIKHLASKTKELGGLPKLKALELAKFYAKGDNLNLYSYLFFSKFKNIDTVKFPTRGRNYSEKIRLIEKVLTENKVDKIFINRDISIERTHYDLSYIFGNKLWFRELLKQF